MYDMLHRSFVVRYHPVPSCTSAAKKEDFKAAAIFDEMEKTLKGVRDVLEWFSFLMLTSVRLFILNLPVKSAFN